MIILRFSDYYSRACLERKITENEIYNIRQINLLSTYGSHIIPRHEILFSGLNFKPVSFSSRYSSRSFNKWSCLLCRWTTSSRLVLNVINIVVAQKMLVQSCRYTSDNNQASINFYGYYCCIVPYFTLLKHSYANTFMFECHFRHTLTFSVDVISYNAIVSLTLFRWYTFLNTSLLCMIIWCSI